MQFFRSPSNCTIWKTALIGDWYSTKIMILDFWIFRVPFFVYFNDFNQQKTTLLNNLQFVFYVTALRIINQLELWKVIINYLCKCALVQKKRTQLQKSIWKNWYSFENFVKNLTKSENSTIKCCLQTAVNRIPH